MSYFVNAGGTCSLCNNALNMFINMASSTKECRNCSAVSCGPTCPAGQYLNVATQACLPCSTAILNCVNCYFAGQCTQCQPGYFINSSLLCEKIVCSGVTNCIICLNTSNCYMCDFNSSYYLNPSGSCSLCNNALNMFINMTSSTKECLNCSAVSCGPTCTTGQYLNVASQSCLSCSTAIPNCLSCYFAGHCTQCQIGYFINSSLLCE